MGELLVPGARIILEEGTNKNRKTRYSAIAVYKGDLIVPIVSVRANMVASELIIPKLFGDCSIRAEYTFGKSRFDFLVEKNGEKTLIEVKSCTLFLDDVAKFPDAPTTRGTKHIKELYTAAQMGYKAMVIFVVFNPEASVFTPNKETDPMFSKTLLEVSKSVKIIPYRVGVSPNGDVELIGETDIKW
jgi:sugar fermentation stimulation protein A